MKKILIAVLKLPFRAQLVPPFIQNLVWVLPVGDQVRTKSVKQRTWYGDDMATIAF
jgi:hypothetical protein